MTSPTSIGILRLVFVLKGVIKKKELDQQKLIIIFFSNFTSENDVAINRIP